LEAIPIKKRMAGSDVHAIKQGTPADRPLAAMNPDSKRIRCRWWLWLAGLGVVPVLVVTGWLAMQARPKHGYFEARRTEISTAAVEPERIETGGFVSQAVRVRGANGLTVDLRVLRPAGVAVRRPLVVLLGGHRTGRDAVDLLGAPGSFVVAALDYPYDGPERPRGLSQSLATVPAARRALLETPPAVRLALDWLLAQTWVDPARVDLVGVSLGVPFAAVAGALDPRFGRVWLIHGGAGNREWIEHNLKTKIESERWRRLTGGLVYLLAHGPTLEPEVWVPQIAPRPLIVIGAREDRRLPPQLVERLHAAASAPKELIWTEGGHVDRRPEAVRRLLDTVRTRLLAE
jgi:dienelactone hydrolase